jgi:AraC family transcriptional regulator
VAESSSLDRLHAATDLVTVAAFRCPVDDPRFRDSGPIGQSCFVFPRTSVVIAHDTGAPFLCDATIATLYNRGQRYERRSVSPEGDRCDWFGVTDDLAREVARSLDITIDDAPRPIRYARAPVPVALYRRQRRFFVAVRDREVVDPLAIEETTISLLRAVLASAYADACRLERPDQRSARAELVAAAREMIARDFATPLTLSSLAIRLGCSPFHLCRAFSGETGTTLHAYQTDLRLRATLEGVEAGGRLTDVALEAGFSSHSHFTQAFRRAFGVPPSAVFRARAARARS